MKVSPSAIKQWQICPRRWTFRRIGRLPEPQSPQQAEGTALHALAEAWLKDSELTGSPNHVRIFEEGIPYLPRPGTCLVEHPVEVVLEGVTFHGIVDCIDPASRRKIDHKFVGSFAYTADLATDPQAILYSLAEPAWEETALLWLYYSKRGAGVQPVEYTMARHYAEAYARTHLVPIGQAMCALEEIFTGLTPVEAVPLCNLVPLDYHGCWAFSRPCPYGGVCER